MAVRQRRYPKDELAERGQKLYESGIRQQVEAGNEGKIVRCLSFRGTEFEEKSMMEGVVNLRREATLRIVVGNSNRQLQAVDAVIDTGFNGFLSLPSTIIATLNLPWSGSDFVTLGDGSETYFDLYTGTVIWDGQYQEIDIAESETEPLLGMALLYRYRLQVDNIEGGKVKIEAL